MKELLMIRGAGVLLDTCAAVKAGETVLIVTDPEMTSIARVLATAAYDRHAEPIICVMPPRTRDSSEPPTAVAEAMKRADVIFTPVSYSITHSQATVDATRAGARMIALSAFTEEMLIRGGINADFNALSPVCRGVADVFTRGTTLRLTTDAGTDLTASIEGRSGNACDCLVASGEFSPAPNVEANVSPVEGTANGRLVIDASIPYLGIGIVQEPLVIEVEDGFMTRIEGGREADTLRRALEEQDQPLSYNIAEVGVGLNPQSRMIGVMLEDEGVLRTVHIGTGTNITLGGHTRAASHYDLLMWNPTLRIDDRVLLREGVVVLEG